MRILIATVQVPFIRGGAENHSEGLRDALREAGHEADIVAIPYSWDSPEIIVEHLLACRLLKLSTRSGTCADLLIGLKFPAYLIPHPAKVLWILHQHRQAYDLWDHPLGDLARFPNGAQVRAAIQRADCQLIPEARAVFANSHNVARRLKKFCGIDSTPLYHPPRHAEKFYRAEAEDYIFFPSRLVQSKRQSLVLEALALTRHPVRVHFAGDADHPPAADALKAQAAGLGVEGRVRWLGRVGERKKIECYARSLGIVYPPLDEDYGYVTLEGMLSSKPIITCADSGGPLEFVRHRESGLVADPTPEALAAAMDELWAKRRRAKSWGAAGRDYYDSLGITWAKVVESLLS